MTMPGETCPRCKSSNVAGSPKGTDKRHCGNCRTTWTNPNNSQDVGCKTTERQR